MCTGRQVAHKSYTDQDYNLEPQMYGREATYPMQIFPHDNEIIPYRNIKNNNFEIV